MLIIKKSSVMLFEIKHVHELLKIIFMIVMIIHGIMFVLNGWMKNQMVK